MADAKKDKLQIRNSTVDFLVFTKDAHEDGIEVRVQDHDVWLTQKAIARLFDVDRSVVTKHLKNVYESGELSEDATCANFAQVADNGKTYHYKFYSLSAIIAVGYRINSGRATQFRQWATKVLDTFTKQGYVVPDGNWKPTEGQEPRIAPEAPTGFFRLELRLGEERAELTLPAGQELVEVRERMEAVGLPNCAVTAFHSRVPQLPAAWATPERLDTLNCLAIRLMVLAERDSLALIKYKAVLEVSSISSLEDAMALTERLDAYNLNWAAASPEDVARGELRRSMGEENADLLCWYLNLYGYGEALIQQYGGELTDYGLLTRADGQPVQKPLPPQPGLNSMGMRCP